MIVTINRKDSDVYAHWEINVYGQWRELISHSNEEIASMVVDAIVERLDELLKQGIQITTSAPIRGD